VSSAATNFLSRHGASLTSDEQGGFWLNYTVPGVEFGERVIERLAVYLPLAAGNLDAAGASSNDAIIPSPKCFTSEPR
jgi:hypothetical protein